LKDWGFNYHPSSCTKCYNKWRRQEALKNKKEHTNINIEIADNLIVTTNVKKKLEKKAEILVPISEESKTISKKIDQSFYWFILIIIGVPLAAYLIFGNYYILIFSYPFLLLIFYLHDKYEAKQYDKLAEERSKRKPHVDKLIIELAQKRKEELEEARRFYQSAEWRLLRTKIIKSHQNVCRICRKKLTEKGDVTIDHVLPRSKFPESALDIANLQVLCRSCNSSKSNKVYEELCNEILGVKND